MLTLYGAPRTRSARVSWLLEELGLTWQYHYINFAKGDSQHPDFLTLNPYGKIPLLIDENKAAQHSPVTLSESTAICSFLVERYNDTSSTPLYQPTNGTPDSARYHQWISFITCELEQPLWTFAKHKFALPKTLRQESMQAVAIWEFDKAASIAESWLPNSDYLFGETLSIADILLTHTLQWATKSGITLTPKLAQYLKNVACRPALSRASAIEEAAAVRAA
ncbi:glutathione S-transferase family protein [uncultured Shewanella sp.]|uniref:glutathione S-transferase family protein n=1 Tax=uncultured Shewanella sp. TaxID=173975 RepID=UPI002629A0CA|nr:glutathione S-transferase family protein [uncultured Shewanella sp.]